MRSGDDGDAGASQIGIDGKAVCQRFKY